jgi:lipopolysaccharide/colanic/teichoic acid biosynthesis glycosyltransferase
MIIKRVFDLLFSAVGMLILSPVFLVVAILIKIDSKGPIYFRQDRVGKNSEVFQIHKFRTMEINSEHLGKITIGEDKRITNLGKWLRKNKIDELPQLIDVLYGKMSLVGPRPELKEYVDTYPKDVKKKILSVRPGITDLASIEMINESLIMAKYSDPHDAYINKIMPIKLDLCAKYVENRTIFLDVKIILLTIKNIILTK